jgi:hypothetical protein
MIGGDPAQVGWNNFPVETRYVPGTAIFSAGMFRIPVAESFWSGGEHYSLGTKEDVLALIKDLQAVIEKVHADTVGERELFDQGAA